MMGKINDFSFSDAFDHELMMTCLSEIQSGRPTKVPVYDFKTNSRKEGEYTTIYPSDVVLLEGILVFYHQDIRDMFDMKLFVDTDADTRLARRGKILLDPKHTLPLLFKLHNNLISPNKLHKHFKQNIKNIFNF